MRVVPTAVGDAARGWDAQAGDLAAAAGQIGAAATGGFTSAVAGAAARFAGTWQDHARTLADRAQEQAEGLRVVLADLLETDAQVGSEVGSLGDRLTEPR